MLQLSFNILEHKEKDFRRRKIIFIYFNLMNLLTRIQNFIMCL